MGFTIQVAHLFMFYIYLYILAFKKQKTCTVFLPSYSRRHEWKFGRTRNAVETRAAVECFHSFFEFFQTFTSVSITRQKHGEHDFYFFQKTPRRKRKKKIVLVPSQFVPSSMFLLSFITQIGPSARSDWSKTYVSSEYKTRF